MPGQVEATPEAMMRCAAILGRSIGDIGRIQNRVRVTSRGLAATWTGQASNAYQLAMDTWDREMADILHAMDWLQDNMTRGGAYYADSEESVRRAVDQLHSGFNTVGVTPFFKS